MPKKTAPEPEEKVKSLNRIIAEINKKSGETVIGRMAKMETATVPRISSGIKAVDDAIGGGFPMRRIVELYGLPSGGKSLLSLFLIKSAQEQGHECVYVDVEDSFDPDWAKKVGVDTDKLILAQSMVGEDVMNMVCKLLEGKPGVIVVDSVAALIPREEHQEGVEKATMALKARLMARGLSKINALNKNTLVVFINQLRATMALYGAQTTTTGGRSLPHYASIRMEIKKGDPIHEDDKKTKDIIGQVVNFRVTKNKTAPPWKQGRFKFYYDTAKIEE